VARNQRFPHARRSRMPRARYALIGAAGALAAILVLPAAGPRGQVLDLKGDRAPVVIAQGPTPATGTPSPAPVVTAPPAPSAAPGLRADDAMRPAAFGYDIPRSVPGRGLTAPRAPSLDLLTGYRWPLAHPRLTLPFGPTSWGSRMVNGQRFHDGVDLATFCGDHVMAAHDGVVLAAGRHYDAVMGWVGDLGPYLRRLDRMGIWMSLPNVVVTDDGNGYRSMYAHFSQIVVRKGQVVKAGQLLGYEGATGRASGCHVHYGLFSPLETATFAIRRDVAQRMKLPKTEIARVDPLLVLPPRAGINAPKVKKAAPPAGSPASP
jgi:murein DD-endopeptidase MepM/ murein hydrolase activator NlpD